MAKDIHRRLAAILAADVVGYSRLMGEDEAGTHAALKAHRAELLDPKATQYNGHTIKLTGDGALMEFPSVVEAVGFAVEVQLAMRKRNAELPEERQILYRIGINIGDIIVEDDDIFGDGVNIAARLEALAEPGGICVARNVFNQVKGKLDLNFEHLGEKQVKNIAGAVSVYRVVMDDKAEHLITSVQASTSPRRLQPALVAAGILLFAAIMGLAWWRPWITEVNQVALGTSELPARDAATIAVLPFDNLGGGRELDYFSDGMTEDIITELSKYPNLRVISRTSSFTLKGKAVTARQVGEDFGVRYVLEGSVRKQGDKVRITAQLIDAGTDTHVWADRFDEEGTDIFALQDRIAEKINGTLAGHGGSINKAEYKRVWAMDAAKLEEYDYYLRGHSIFFDFTSEALLKAREIFREGLWKFPDSGLLRVKIGWTYFQFYYLGFSTEPEKDMEQADQFVRKGLADQDLPLIGQWYGHWLNAFVQLYYHQNHERALEEAVTTVRYAPNHSETLADSALIAVHAGAEDLALEWITRAISLEPRVPDWYYKNLGLAYHRKGECNRAIEQLEKISWVAVGKSAALIGCYVKLQRLEDARVELVKLLEETPGLSVESVSRDLPYKDRKFLDGLLVSLREVGLSE